MATYRNIVELKQQLYDLIPDFTQNKDIADLYQQSYLYAQQYNIDNRIKKTQHQKYWLSNEFNQTPLEFNDMFISTTHLINSYNNFSIKSNAHVWSKLYNVTTQSFIENFGGDSFSAEENYYYYMSMGLYIDNLATPFLYGYNGTLTATSSVQSYTLNENIALLELPANQTYKMSISYPTLSEVNNYNQINSQDVYFNPLVFRTKYRLPQNELPKIYTYNLLSSPICSTMGLYLQKSNQDTEYDFLSI